VKKVVEGFFFI